MSPTSLSAAPVSPVVPGSAALGLRLRRLCGAAPLSVFHGLMVALITIGSLGAEATGEQDYAPIAPKALASTMIDVERALLLAANDCRFDVRNPDDPPRKDTHGD